jgi:hypothetical protein
MRAALASESSNRAVSECDCQMLLVDWINEILEPEPSR